MKVTIDSALNRLEDLYNIMEKNYMMLFKQFKMILTFFLKNFFLIFFCYML